MHDLVGGEQSAQMFGHHEAVFPDFPRTVRHRVARTKQALVGFLVVFLELILLPARNQPRHRALPRTKAYRRPSPPKVLSAVVALRLVLVCPVVSRFLVLFRLPILSRPLAPPLQLGFFVLVRHDNSPGRLSPFLRIFYNIGRWGARRG